MTRPAGRVKAVSKSRGSSRVGSGRVGSGRVGSGRVGSGRVGSIDFKISRVGSGRVKKFSKSRGSTMTRELFSADPRVNPADLTAEGHCRAGVPRVRPSDP